MIGRDARVCTSRLEQFLPEIKNGGVIVKDSLGGVRQICSSFSHATFSGLAAILLPPKQQPAMMISTALVLPALPQFRRPTNEES